jgi:hypothetical protein
MHCCTHPLGLLRSLASLSLLGLAVVVLIGPVLAIAGVLLPFAVIGALAWGAYRLVRWLGWRVWRGRRRHVVILPKEPELALVAEEPSADPAPRPTRLRRGLRTALNVIFEVGCGAALGLGLALLAGWQTGVVLEYAPLGAVIGAVVGFVVGGSRPFSGQEAPEESARPAVRAA